MSRPAIGAAVGFFLVAIALAGGIHASQPHVSQAPASQAPASQAHASQAPLPAGVTATVERLARELDERGRTAISEDLDALVRKHPLASIDPSTRLRIARLSLSLRGLAAAAPIARTALKELGIPAEITATAAAALGKHEPDTLERVAIGLIAVGRRKEAVVVIHACWNAHPSTWRSCRATGVAGVLAQMAWHDDAEKLMTAMAARDDGSDRAQTINLVLDRAHVAQSAGRYVHQLAVVEKAIARFGPIGALLDGRTAALRRLGRYQDAMTRLAKLARSAPSTPGIVARHFHAFLNFEGAATHRNGPYAAYAAAKEKLLDRARADKSDAPAVFVAAMMALRDARYEDADGLFATLPKLVPKDSRPVAMRGFVALWIGDAGRAEKLAAAAQRVDPNDAAVPYLRSLIARSRNDAKSAASELQRFVTMRRDRATLRFRRKRRAVLSTLYALRRGELPDDTDRPDHPSRRYHRNSLHEPFELPPPSVLVGTGIAFLAALAFGALLTWRRRRD